MGATDELIADVEREIARSRVLIAERRALIAIMERDDRSATQWLRRSAEGVAMAQYWYGRMLVEGRGVEADPAEGRVWLTRAADAGVAEAQVMLGEMMVNGRGGPRDREVALNLTKRGFRMVTITWGASLPPVDSLTAVAVDAATADTDGAKLACSATGDLGP